MKLVVFSVSVLLLLEGSIGGVIDCNGNGWTFEYVQGAFTFDEAKSECAKRQSSLATIQDAQDQRIVHEITARHPRTSCKAYDKQTYCSAWIGLKRVTPTSNVFAWQSGSSSYRNFYQGQPDNELGQEACVHINALSTGEWNDLKCSQPMGAICRRKSHIPKRTNSLGEVLEYLKGDFTFDEAKAACAARQGTLATINDARDQRLVHEITGREPGMSCKAFDTKTHCSAWIGLRRIASSSNVFRWQSGSSSYRNFYQGQPDNEFGHEGCVHVNALSTGEWNDLKCTERMGAICKRSAGSPKVC